MGRPERRLLPASGSRSGNKSLLVVIATDAPLLPIQLQRLCKRAALGMARTGGISTAGSGDLLLAFSTGQKLAREAATSLQMLSNGVITKLYQGVVEATEEAILNALTAAYTMVGRDGNTIHALPLARLVEIMRRHGKIK